jgi:hypothetical protein
MRGLKRRLTPTILMLALWPGVSAAQVEGERPREAGVVTTLAGTVTVARTALPAPRPLHFKDDVFVRDHIATAEKSLVRMLLGGKALVTVRELSSLTIKEETGRSTVDLSSGKIAMGVLRQRMRPGEVIEIRTPNAIAAIRGTVLVVELIPAPGGTPSRPNYTTRVHVLHGLVEVSDPNDPSAPPAQVGTLQSWSRTGSEPFSQTTIPLVGVDQMFADLRSRPQIAEGPVEFMTSVTVREQAKALAVAEFLAPEMAGASAGGDGESPTTPGEHGPGAGTPGVTDAPVVPVLDLLRASAPLLGLTNGTVTTQQSLVALSGSDNVQLSQVAALTASSLTVANHAVSLSGRSRLTVTGDLFRVANGSALAVTNGALLSLSGNSSLTVAGALIRFIGSGNSLSITNNLCGNGGCSLIGGLPVFLTGGGSIVLSNPVANLAGNTLNIAPGSAVISVTGGATVTQGQ